MCVCKFTRKILRSRLHAALVAEMTEIWSVPYLFITLSHEHSIAVRKLRSLPHLMKLKYRITFKKKRVPALIHKNLLNNPIWNILHTCIFFRHIVINMPFEDLVHYDGCCFPPFPPLAKDAKKHLEALQNMKTRADDVIMITFPKCGMKIVLYFMKIFSIINID